MKFPAWLKIALAERGVREIPGVQAHPRILQYFKKTTYHAASDEVSWCSAFVCWCLETGGVLSSRSAAARSYTNWGVPIEKPVVGCVAVLTRSDDPTMGHVGFWVGESETEVLLFGGNQGDMVGLAVFEKSRVIGYRMPSHDVKGVKL